jgi:hypothetical protein
VVAVSLDSSRLNGPDLPPHFEQQILILTIIMLLAFFTLHKVQNISVVSDLDRKKILRGFHWKLAILRNLDGGIQMVEGHYFKIVSTIYFSNWNVISSGFHHATHLVWLQEWHPLQYKGLWCYGCTCTIIYKYSVHVLVPAQVYRYRF